MRWIARTLKSDVELQICSGDKRFKSRLKEIDDLLFLQSEHGEKPSKRAVAKRPKKENGTIILGADMGTALHCAKFGLFLERLFPIPRTPPSAETTPPPERSTLFLKA